MVRGTERQSRCGFASELDTAIDRIAEAPSRWPEYLEGTRRYVMRRFPYLVVYRVMLDRVQVVAIAHGHRRPGYWRSRGTESA